MADLQLTLNLEDNVSAKFVFIGRAVMDFAKDSVRAFAEQEKADRQLDAALKQLGYDAAALGPAFRAQASDMQAALGVSDDMVQSMQTLMLRFGTAPKDIEPTTRALLDYAAATGTDATAAAQQLMSAVERGSSALGKSGVVIDATGDKTQDLARFVEVLGARFGGAAAANADTLEGRVRKATEALGEVKEAFGGMMAAVEAKTGILQAATDSLKSFGELLALDLKRLAAGAVLGDFGNELQRQLDAKFEADLAAKKAQREAMEASAASQPLTITPIDVDLGKIASAKEAASKRAVDAMNAEIDAVRQLEEAKRSKRDEEWKEIQLQDKLADSLQEASAEMWKEIAAQDAAAAKELERQLAREAQALGQQQRNFQQAGERIGSAFAGALAGEIEQLLAGGEFDLAGLVGGLLPVIFGAIGMAVPIPGAAAAFGAFGTLAGAAIRGASRGERRRGVRHNGGWVDDGGPYFHDGGWPGLASDEVPIIAQKGEYVMSRQEVAESQRAPRLVLNVSSMDAKGVREFFEDRGGRGFYNAVRSGRGDVARLLRGRK